MPSFGLVTALLTLVVVATAALLRGRFYAIFASVLLTFHGLSASAIFGVLAPTGLSGVLSLPGPERAVALVFLAHHAVVYVHFLGLVRARLRPTAYRLLVSWPASTFFAGTFLAIPWALASSFGLEPIGLVLPYGAALFGLLQSLRHRPEEIDLVLDRQPIARLGRHPRGATDGSKLARPLRLVQITDPHLGMFMSEHRLRGLCERAVAKNPDLVLLTGDFLTMESHDAEDVLARALSPLRALEGRVFACMGNHDHEAPRTVLGALRAVGARMLVDEAEIVSTEFGPVQVVGLDFHFRERKERIEGALRAIPRVAGALRLVLLHDPGAFRHVPEGEADLVLSGHTHGGQLGLVSLGLEHTVVGALTNIPDHGFWAEGTKRLYVHRGTCHYGFPVRVGVPAEESLVRVHVALDAAAE